MGRARGVKIIYESNFEGLSGFHNNMAIDNIEHSFELDYLLRFARR